MWETKIQTHTKLQKVLQFIFLNISDGKSEDSELNDSQLSPKLIGSQCFKDTFFILPSFQIIFLSYFNDFFYLNSDCDFVFNTVDDI